MADTDLVFLHCNYMPRCQLTVDKHFDGYHTLQFMTRGAIYLSYDGQRRILKGRWFWSGYPGPHTEFGPAEHVQWWEHRYVAFRGPLVVRWASEGILLRQPQPAPAGKKWALRFDQLLRCVRVSDPGDRWSQRRAINLLEGLLIDLAEARGEATSAAERHPWLARVLAELARQSTQMPAYAQLARSAGMSLSTLRRQFRQVTGTPLHTYALQLRIAQARQLLGETDLPIKEIADQLGYHDLFYFTRQFQQKVGAPPAQYRRSRQR